MARQNDQLFELIRSLSAHEKGYIRRLAAAHGNPDEQNYLKLFDAIDRQKSYDEAALKKKLSKEKFMRNFPGAKNYLQQAILRYLESYHDSPAKEVRSLLNQYSILRRKGLIPLSYKQLMRAWKLCEKHEHDHLRTEVLATLLGHVITYGGNPPWPGGAGALLEQIRESSELNREASTMRYEMHLLRQQTPGLIRARSAEQSNELLAKAEQLLRYDKSRLKTFDTRYQYYQLLTNYYFICSETEKGLFYATELCQWLKENRQYARSKDRAFVTAFYNQALYELMLYKPVARESIEALGQLVQEIHPGNADSLLLVYRLRLIEAWETCRFADVLEHSAATLDFLRSHKAQINRPGEDLICLMLAACAHFALGGLDAAAKALRQLLRDPFSEKAQALASSARIFLLIVEFERGDRIGIESQVQSTYRYLLRKKQLHKTENAVLGFIRVSIRKIHNEAEMKAAFTKLKAEVQLALADKNEEMGARLFDLVSYLESRISGESFAEVRKKTAEKNWGMKL